MELLTRIRQHNGTALIFAGGQLSYAQLYSAISQRASQLQQGQLVILEMANTVTSTINLLSCFLARCPAVLVAPGQKVYRVELSKRFHVNWQVSDDGWFLVDNKTVRLNDELCLLLPTSGSTGSSKLVRLSRSNLMSNVAAISQYLALAADHVAITSLPLFYSYGLSVFTSHLYAGAVIVVSDHSLVEREFWQQINNNYVTSLAGIPFQYEFMQQRRMLDKLPISLRYLTQAGGRLASNLLESYSDWSLRSQRQFFVMYGQTEAAPRMAYLPAEFLHRKIGSIGIAIPGGSLSVSPLSEDDRNNVSVEGELVYTGSNVMMGYANKQADLVLGQGSPILHTGDLGYRDEDGFFYITGRKQRFAKLSGVRINLDDVEHWLRERSLIVACTSDDLELRVYHEGAIPKDISLALVDWLQVHPSKLTFIEVDRMPKLPNGKLDYQRLSRENG